MGNDSDSPARPPNAALATATDEVVLARIRAGDRGGFEVLIRRHNRRIYRTVRAILGADAEAEDAMQDAYVQAFKHLNDFEGRSTFATWLTRIAVREAIARKKRTSREADLGIDRDSEEEEMASMRTMVASPEEQASSGELRELLEGVIDELPEHFRAVFMLRAVEELSVAETAACLEIQEETVKTRLHRARALLQESLLKRADREAVEMFAFPATRCDRVVSGVLASLSTPSESH